jgi:hypothetical protein
MKPNLLWAVVPCVALVGLTLAGCAYVAEETAPRKQAAASRSAATLQADDLFWSTLHAGEYSRIGPALEAQTAAYLATPTDATSAAHVGFLHIWKVSERLRVAPAPATITDDIVLARRYFEEAVELNPGDARYLGFLASTTLAEGNINQDERLTRRGYFMLLDSIEAWPEFNLFTAGYVMSAQPAGSARFKQALQWQWETLDVCVGEKVDRHTGSYAQYMKLETREGKKRVCWNSTIAPHNFEGFFLNMGDMLVKSGDVETARRIYANAKLSATYAEWSYREVLEERIRDAAANVSAFNAPVDESGQGDRQIMVASRFACMACHQR